MKISVRNLGAIKEAVFDLKPLTVFIGPNNAGKTWLAYTLSGILGHYEFRRYRDGYIGNDVPERYPSLETAIQRVLEEGNTKIDLVQFAEQYGETYINSVANFARSEMGHFMRTNRVTFKNLRVHIDLGKTKETFLRRVLDYSLESSIAVGLGQRKPLLNILKEAGKREVYVYTSTEESISEKLPARAIKRALVDSTFQALHSALYPAVYTFATERSAFTAFPIFQLIGNDPFAEQTQTILMRRMTEPVSFFQNMIATAFQSSTLERELEAKNDSMIRGYIQLAQLLEKQVLGGGVDFSTPEPDPGREIFFQLTEGVRLEIPITSSMVKELSSLVLYLRYLAKPRELLVIDEPEMNLHPKAQVQLTEFLAMLVNAGLHVLITTHSPYIVDHLTNLMKAAESTEPEAIQDKFYLQHKEAFIARDNVSVYLIDEGKAENMVDEDGVVRWGTFGTVSDRVSELYFEL